jgi:NAD(P)-dependent dehydrogenase (short-subunit alcohol dehydrogenase family)
MRVLVTGASGGLGPAVVNEFLKAGASVAGAARSWSGQEDRFLRISADLTKPGDCRRMIAEAGNPDVVVHAMGGYAGGTTVDETEDSTWHKMMDLNLNSAFYVFRAALPPMLEAKRGRLIAIGSPMALQPATRHAAYGVSKAALVHLVRTIAIEVKRDGITANIVLPGTMDTEANRRAMPGADKSNWVQPESVAKVVAWLASAEATDVNGAVIPAYGRS